MMPELTAQETDLLIRALAVASRHYLDKYEDNLPDVGETRQDCLTMHEEIRALWRKVVTA